MAVFDDANYRSKWRFDLECVATVCQPIGTASDRQYAAVIQCIVFHFVPERAVKDSNLRSAEERPRLSLEALPDLSRRA